MATPHIIGEGSFGVVVEPALPNVNMYGNPITFGPDTVTKIMFRKKNFDKLMADESAIHEKVPSLSVNIQPYRRTFTEANIADIAKMANYIATRPIRNGVYPVRMPHLGITLSEITRDAERMAHLRSTVSPSAMLSQILKLMNVVKAIKDAGYIHTDIRELNVLCSTKGELTIIDFDWFMTREDHQQRYPQYYYSVPPESLFLLDKALKIDDFLKSKPSRSTFLQGVKKAATRYFNENNVDEYWKYYMPTGTTREEFIDLLVANMEYMYNTAKNSGIQETLDRYRNMYYNTVDSFGLAIALHRFAMGFFDDEVRAFMNWLCSHMLEINPKKRMTIEDAIEHMKGYIPEDAASFSDEVARMNALAELMNIKRHRSSERRTLRQQVEGLAVLTKRLEGLSSPKSQSGGRTAKRKRPLRGTRRRLL